MSKILFKGEKAARLVMEALNFGVKETGEVFDNETGVTVESPTGLVVTISNLAGIVSVDGAPVLFTSDIFDMMEAAELIVKNKRKKP